MEGRQVYYGTECIEAWPEQRADNTGPGGQMVDGYTVLYPDGYRSWSPKDVFEATYRPATCMGFEGALAAMREGHRVRRIGIDAEGISIWLSGDNFYCQRAGSYAGVWWPNPNSLLADWMIVELGAEHTGWAG